MLIGLHLAKWSLPMSEQLCHWRLARPHLQNMLLRQVTPPLPPLPLPSLSRRSWPKLHAGWQLARHMIRDTIFVEKMFFWHSYTLYDALQESYSAQACIYGEVVLLSRWLGRTLPMQWLLLWPSLTKPTNPKLPGDLIRSLGSQASRQQHVSPLIFCLWTQNDSKFSGSHFSYSLVP